MSFLENKKCEQCGESIPDDFINLLCGKCYRLNLTGISDENYVEREEVPDLDMVSRSHGRFKDTGLVMPQGQRVMYEAIRDWFRDHITMKDINFPKYNWKPKVCDVGCGLGIGANIMSQEATYVLGVDKLEENVNWATQMFTRQKNSIYWSPQVDFMVVDVQSEVREFMKFDVVTCIEIIEHLKNPQDLINFVKGLMHNNSVAFFSTPNRDSEHINNNTPNNEHHVREWTAKEFKDYLGKHFRSVTLYDAKLNPIEHEEGDTTTISKVTPIIALCKQT